MRAACALVLTTVLAACGPREVPVSPHTVASTSSALSANPPRTVDLRELHGHVTGSIGTLTFAEGENQVHVKPTPGQLVADALRAELISMGHHVGVEGATATIDGNIRAFFVFQLDSPELGYGVYDLRGVIRLSVIAASGSRSATGDYKAECVAHPRFFISYTAIDQLVRTCLNDIARQFRDDQAIAQVLGR